MKTTLYIILLATLGNLLFSSFSLDIEKELPVKSINKSIKKIWGVEEFRLKVKAQSDCSSAGCWYEIMGKDGKIGMMYSGRVNSCRSGGCSIDDDEQKLSYEFFDYFMLADTDGKILWVKVFNYQATQGHEVMSRGWLNQFKGLTSEKHIILGEDIETISGATISAKAITDDIQQVIACIPSI